ncbi:KamA family radical SAM protein [Rhodohalobacter barkolensis]|uniref:Lysine 2,3-aminomutase n=1 Tax=Rhodohalobacter barkolensis TaxID=2053187 RepID=A0A2N0VGT1_9BACT|nr:lysine 2,3-aminomutase [Rhodohalobacter barkolensis]
MITNGHSDFSVQNYKPYTLRNFREIPQMEKLSEEEKFAIEVVGSVLPFKANNYVIDELIDWDNAPDDPIFILTFPVKELLKDEHFNTMADLIRSGASKNEIKAKANEIRLQLNPNPAGQMDHNVPQYHKEKLEGIQHKYRETALFFPSQGQTCHAYCSFCFRWPQFVGMKDYRFATREIEKLIGYLRENPQVTDVLITGGDPMVMKAEILEQYINPLLEADLPNLQNIRIGSKSLSYWPYKYVTDRDANKTLNLFRKVVDSGIHLAFMAHFNHPVEQETAIVKKAIQNIQQTGAVIRTQSPLLYKINDHPDIWAKMWQQQVQMGIIPYYMFVVRNTGAQHFYGIPLERAWHIFREAYQQTSGLGRTVRGPSMSAHPGKVQILGVEEIHGEKVFVLRLIQGRNPDWVDRPFFAEYNPDAIWLDDLKPAFGRSKFFFEKDLKKSQSNKVRSV